MPHDEGTLWKERRTIAKNVNFGVFYGLFARGLQRTLRFKAGLDKSLSDCEAIIANLKAGYPNLARWQEQAKQAAAVAAERKSQIGSGDRSERVRTYNFPQNRVTDHRLTGDNKNFNIAAVMNGDLDPMIDALILNDQAQRLQESKEE